MPQAPSDYRNRVTRSLTEEDYSLVNFLAYCLYPPLYIAGPIITFNDFVWQVSTSPTGAACLLFVTATRQLS
jgi:D-alanyl-lipoteichoic acid acyltransferase DltB (MBOAT superfamily)